MVFHQSRDTNTLKQHWLYLKQLNLLIDQQTEITIDDVNESFEEKEKKLNDKEIIENVNINFEVEEGLCVYLLIIYV